MPQKKKQTQNCAVQMLHEELSSVGVCRAGHVSARLSLLTERFHCRDSSSCVIGDSQIGEMLSINVRLH